jgi:NAD(P)-dependent dehydrogenase (short-subunit alcohol dehydrogenase family)
MTEAGMLKHEKILITGPASQVAFPIARELAKDGDLVTVRNDIDSFRIHAKLSPSVPP